MIICPLRMGRQELARECVQDECAWWDELEGRCIVVSVGRKLAVVGNWILLEKLLRDQVVEGGGTGVGERGFSRR